MVGEVPIYPALLTIGPFSLATYGVLVAAGYVAAIWWLKGRRGEMGLSEDAFWDLIYWLFGGALIGGKIGYVIVERDATLLWHDVRYGFVFYGGFVGAVLAGVVASRRLKFDFAKLADYFGVGLPIGHAIGRLGCLAAGCCYGSHTDWPWGVALAGDPSRHPTQVYESLANALIAFLVARIGLARTRDGRWTRGAAFAMYVGLYAIARFGIEFFRGDDRGFMWRGLSPSQWAALAVIAAIGAAVWRRKK